MQKKGTKSQASCVIVSATLLENKMCVYCARSGISFFVVMPQSFIINSLEVL